MKRLEQAPRGPKDPVATAFLTLSLIFGALFMFLTPPFQVPDEPAHFFRAYAISEGSFRIHTWDGVAAQPLPASLPAFAADLAGARIRNPREHITIAEISASARHRFESDRRLLAIIPSGRPGPLAFTAGGYLPLLYIPQAFAIWLMRVLDAPLLGAFYAARGVNLGLSLILCYLAIRNARFGKTVLAAIGLLPMVVVLRSSLSPDSILIGLALLAFALVLRHSASETVASWRSVSTVLLLTFLIAIAKPIYLLMPLLALALPWGERNTARAAALYGSSLAAILIATAVSVLWVVAPLHESSEAPPGLLWHAQSLKHEPHTASESDVNLTQQAASIIRRPFGFVNLTVREYWMRSGELMETFTGRFGWLDTVLPATVRNTLVLYLLFAGLLDGHSRLMLTSRQRLVLGGLFAGTLFVTAALLYVVWTPVGASRIDGIQGRYLIPVAPALLLLLTSRRLAPVLSSRSRAILLILIGSISLIVSAWASAARFFGVIDPPV